MPRRYNDTLAFGPKQTAVIALTVESFGDNPPLENLDLRTRLNQAVTNRTEIRLTANDLALLAPRLEAYRIYATNKAQAAAAHTSCCEFCTPDQALKEYRRIKANITSITNTSTWMLRTIRNEAV